MTKPPEKISLVAVPRQGRHLAYPGIHLVAITLHLDRCSTAAHVPGLGNLPAVKKVKFTIY